MITAEERRTLLEELMRSRRLLLESIAGLSVEQWTFRPEPGSYSLADCVEHLAAGETSIVARLADRIKSGPPDGASDPAKDTLIRKGVPRRKHKVKAPPEMEVRSAPATPEAGAQRFDQARAATLAFLENTSGDLRGYTVPHFLMGPLDGFQWMLLLAFHVDRHLLQIEEIKAHSRFP